MSESFSDDPSSYPPEPPQRKGDSAVKIVLIVIGAILALGILVVGCCGVFGWYFTREMKEFGEKMIAEVSMEMIRDFEDDPIVQEKLGGIDDAKMNFGATAAEQQRTNEPEILVYDVTGPKGSGKLIVRHSPDRAGFERAVLRTDEGEWELDVASVQPPETTIDEPAELESGVEDAAVEEPGVEEPRVEEPAVEEAGVEEPGVEEAGEKPAAPTDANENESGATN